MNYSGIHEFLENYDRDNVVFCCGNYAVADMVKNLVMSAQRIGVPIVVFAFDKRMSDVFMGVCDVVDYFDENVDPNKLYRYDSEEFRDVVWQQWLIGNEILKSGRSYTYMDIDVVVIKNFEEDMQGLYEGKNYDCLIQYNTFGRYNSIDCCPGFYSMRPTEITVNLFTMDFLLSHDYTLYPHDQSFLNIVVMGNKMLNVKLLDRDEYPVGEYYYKNHERIDGVCRIIHFNYIVGYEPKIEKMKEFGYWNLK